MAYSMYTMFSSSCPPSPKPTDEEFNLYHSIDRQLYKKLIFDLGRDKAQSMNVMAFWLWLEQEKTGGMTLVKRMLSLPSLLVCALADETAFCLRCVEKDEFSFPENAYELALLPNMMGQNITLKFLHEHRIKVLHGVTRMFTEVCARAFSDINQSHQAVTTSFSGYGGDVNIRAPVMGLPRGLVTSRALEGVSMHGGMQQSRVVNNDLNEMFSGNLNLEEEENNEVSSDERTIFLTFSRGYPLSETEVRNFFTRKYGDIVEEIHMQEVPSGEQVLYARVVARAASMVDKVVQAGRAKFNIHGKHVWARKYVKKGKPSSPVVTTAQTTRPMEPAAD